MPQAQVHIPHHLVCEGHFAVFVRSFPDPSQVGAECYSNFQGPLIKKDLGENFIQALAFLEGNEVDQVDRLCIAKLEYGRLRLDELCQVWTPLSI